MRDMVSHWHTSKCSCYSVDSNPGPARAAGVVCDRSFPIRAFIHSPLLETTVRVLTLHAHYVPLSSSMSVEKTRRTLAHLVGVESASLKLSGNLLLSLRPQRKGCRSYVPRPRMTLATHKGQNSRWRKGDVLHIKELPLPGVTFWLKDSRRKTH